MAFAGLWEQWTDRATGEQIASCTIITTDANTTLAPIHDRMPVLIEADHYDAWLAGGDDLERLLVSPPDTLLTAYRVSTEVNNPRHEDADAIAPVRGDA